MQRHYFAKKGPSSESYGFSSSLVWMWELDYKESWVPKNWCFWTVVLEKALESPLDCKGIQPLQPKGNQSWIFNNCKDWCWSWNSNTLATWCKELTHWKRPWCWERLKAGGEGDNRGWDGWMASPTQWVWVWVNCASWWWTGRPGVLQSMGLQKVGDNWATELTDWATCGRQFIQDHINIGEFMVIFNVIKNLWCQKSTQFLSHIVVRWNLLMYSLNTYSHLFWARYHVGTEVIVLSKKWFIYSWNL